MKIHRERLREAKERRCSAVTILIQGNLNFYLCASGLFHPKKMNLLLHLNTGSLRSQRGGGSSCRCVRQEVKLPVFDSHHGHVRSAIIIIIYFLLHLSTLAALHCSTSQLQSAAFISRPVLSFLRSFLSVFPCCLLPCACWSLAGSSGVFTQNILWCSAELSAHFHIGTTSPLLSTSTSSLFCCSVAVVKKP